MKNKLDINTYIINESTGLCAYGTHAGDVSHPSRPPMHAHSQQSVEKSSI